MTSSIKIFSVIDENYAPYMSVLLSNIKALSSKNKFYEYIVVHKNMPQKALRKLEKLSTKNFKITNFNITEYLEKNNINFPNDIRRGNAMFYRIFAPEIFPQYDKILYLDIDLVIFEDISNLYETNIDNYELAVSKEFFIIHQNTTKKFYYKYEKHLNFFHENLSMYNFENYFNSGVLLMNLDLMRKNNTVKNIVDLFDKYNNLLYGDQDILNRYYYDKYDRIFFLNGSYNFLNPFKPLFKEFSSELYKEYIHCKNNMKILHYVSYKKPWNDYKCPNGIYWWKYGIKQPNLLLNLFKSNILKKLRLTLLMLKCR